MATRAGEEVFRVEFETDRFWCASEARRFASGVGFAERAQWEVAIVVAELVSNAVRYAGCGTVTFRTVPAPRSGMEIVVADPGRSRAERAGEETRGAADADPRCGLGIGLRTVRCLTHELSVEAGSAGGGTVVTATRYLEP